MFLPLQPLLNWMSKKKMTKIPYSVHRHIGLCASNRTNIKSSYCGILSSKTVSGLQISTCTITISIIYYIWVLCAKHCAKWFTHTISLTLHISSDSFIIPISPIRKLRLNEVSWFAQHWTAGKWRSWDSNPGIQEPSLLTPTPIPLPKPWCVNTSQGSGESMFLWKCYKLWKEGANYDISVIKN